MIFPLYELDSVGLRVSEPFVVVFGVTEVSLKPNIVSPFVSVPVILFKVVELPCKSRVPLTSMVLDAEKRLETPDLTVAPDEIFTVPKY